MNKLQIVLEIYEKIINSKIKGSLKILGYVFLIFSVIFYQDIRDIFFNSNLIHDRIQQKKEVRRELKKLCNQYKCAYVAVNLFENGTKSLNGTHYSKMSREYEARGNDSLDVLTYKLQGFSIDPFIDAFDSLEVDRYYYVKDISKMSNQYFKDQVGYFGYKSVLYVAIFDKKWFLGGDQLIGFMTYEYFHTTNFSKSEINAMRKQVQNKVKYLIR